MGLNIGASGHRGIGASENQQNPIGKGSSPAALELHIEELVLHGFSPRDRLSIGDAMQQEILRLITEQGLPGISTGPISLARLDVGSFQVAPGMKARAIGVQLAQHLHPRLSVGSNLQHHAGNERSGNNR